MSEVKINSMYRNFNVVVARGFIPRNWSTTRVRRYERSQTISRWVLFKQVLGMGTYPTKQTG